MDLGLSDRTALVGGASSGLGRATAAALAAEGCRVLVPWLRGYGPTRFVSPDTPRSGEQAALGNDPFIVKDIRVEGIQRIEAGTVFSYLPVKVGDTMNEEKASQAIRSLYATGFFKDVSIEVDGGVLIVVIQDNAD